MRDPQDHYKVKVMLAALEESLPSMLSAHTDRQAFMAAFNEKADAIEDLAGRTEIEHIRRRLAAILIAHDVTA
jgi:hypothetical protein